MDDLIATGPSSSYDYYERTEKSHGLLKNDKTYKLGIKSKRAKAGYDRNYMLTLLGFRAAKAENQ